MPSSFRPSRPDHLQRRHSLLQPNDDLHDLPSSSTSPSRVIYPPQPSNLRSLARPTPKDTPSSSTSRVLRRREAAPQRPSPWSGQPPLFHLPGHSGGDNGPDFDRLDRRAPVAPTPDPLFDALSKMLAEAPSSSSSSSSPSCPSLPASPGRCFCGNPADEDSIYCSVVCGREDAMSALCASHNPAQASNGSHYRRVELAESEKEDARARTRMGAWRFGTASSSAAPASGTRSPPYSTSASSSSRPPRRLKSPSVPPRSESPAESTSSHASTPSLSSSATSCDTEESHPSFASLGYGVEGWEERDFVEIGIGFAGEELKERVRRRMPGEEHRKRKLSFEEMLGLMSG